MPAEIVDVRKAAELAARTGASTDVLDAIAAPVRAASSAAFRTSTISAGTFSRALISRRAC